MSKWNVCPWNPLEGEVIDEPSIYTDPVTMDFVIHGFSRSGGACREGCGPLKPAQHSSPGRVKGLSVPAAQWLLQRCQDTHTCPRPRPCKHSSWLPKSEQDFTKHCLRAFQKTCSCYSSCGRCCAARLESNSLRLCRVALAAELHDTCLGLQHNELSRSALYDAGHHNHGPDLTQLVIVHVDLLFSWKQKANFLPGYLKPFLCIVAHISNILHYRTFSKAFGLLTNIFSRIYVSVHQSIIFGPILYHHSRFG